MPRGPATLFDRSILLGRIKGGEILIFDVTFETLNQELRQHQRWNPTLARLSCVTIKSYYKCKQCVFATRRHAPTRRAVKKVTREQAASKLPTSRVTMAELVPDESRDSIIAPPTTDGLSPARSGPVFNSAGSATHSAASAQHRDFLRDTWLDQIRQQFDDPSTGLQDRILSLVNQHHPGTPVGENRWYYGSYNLSIAFDFYDESAGASVSSTPARGRAPDVTP